MFQVKFGDVVTDTPWVNPTFQSVKKWYSEFENSTDLSNLNLILVGAFAESLTNPSIITKDVDICISTEGYPDLKQLRDVLLNALVTGLNNKLFIDIKWQNDEMFSFYRNLKNIDINSIKKDNLKTIRNYYIFEQKIQQNTHIVDLSKECNLVKLPYGLYELTGFRKSTAEKALNRHKNNIYKGIEYDLNHIFKQEVNEKNSSKC